MPKIAPMLRPLFLAGLVFYSLSAFAQANESPFPGVSAAPTGDAFPGVTPSPIGTKPLSAPPRVVSIDHLEPAQMSDADNEVVSNLSAELGKQAALANFDISQAAWHYQQIACPAFPDYVFLEFSHGPDEDGSSRFGAVLPRDNAEVRVVSTYAHGVLPFNASWNRPGTFEVFNGALRRERGSRPLSYASNWLMISICYAELSGYPVQVLSYLALPDTSLDVQRLDGNQPQMMIEPDQSADVTFSDVSRPGVTTKWMLHFDRLGQIRSAGRSSFRQPERIALRP